MTLRKLPIVAALLALLTVMAFKAALVEPPPVRPAGSAAGFDTGRAAARLARILGDQRPHPVDTAANDAVRDRLVAELRVIGLAPRVTDDFTCGGSPKSQVVRCARIRNVVATIGPATGHHVLVTSHYDSTPVGPGAADDGIGVAVMLETAALLARRELARPVTFLFDEGEEAGLLGAQTFLARDPIAPRVDSLVNLESRGVSGPATMFETNSPNGAALTHFARSAPHASANSLATDMAKLIPNSTDVEVFKARGWTTLNFAIIGNETRYHTPGDTLDALDPRSVQHMGDQALAAIADLAGGPVAASRTQKIYADVLGGRLVVLPAPVGLAGVGIMLLAAAAIAWRRRDSNSGRAMVTIWVAIGAAALLSFALHLAIGLVRPGEYWRAHPAAISFALDASAALSVLGVLAWRRASADAAALRSAFWLSFLILGAALCLIAPGASIYFLAPPLVALAGMAARRVRYAEQLAAIVAAGLLLLTWLPLLALAEVLLDFDRVAAFAAISAIVMLPALIEIARFADRARPLVLVAASVAAAAWACAALLPAYSADRKQAFGLEYVRDSRAANARWMVVHDGAPLPRGFAALGKWTRDIEVPWSSRKRWAVPAAGDVALPRVRLLADAVSGKMRRVSIGVDATGYDAITLALPARARAQSATVNGKRRAFGASSDKAARYQVRCEGRDCSDARIDLVLGETGRLPLTVIGIRNALPASAAPLLRARPATAAPQYNPDATIGVTRVRM